MISKERPFPIKIQKLQVLLLRILETHSKTNFIKENLSKSLAGYNGEKSIDYYLSLLPDKSFYILHDLRLLLNGLYFQIDTLLLTKSFALILEVKNLAGSIDFDSIFNQMIQKKNGVEFALPDPIIQIGRQESQFRSWLHEHHFPPIPIRTLIVISNPQTIIRSHDKNVSQKVIHAALLPQKISQIYNESQNNILLDKDIRRMIKLIKKFDTPLNPSVLNQYNISRQEIINGVFCEICSYLPLDRVHGYWFCPKCKTKSKLAHLKSLEHYNLLFGEEITGQQLKSFLRISSPALATRILNSVCIGYRGKGKGRVHTLPSKQK
ncbi:nuclease-related domain-containing protein [Rossellomorea sp. GCM10028870]|uniref:nuclease-related domain-containing protein n=1 Tax=Rossellomorea sp. GCM10028870 TaxID=3273426 RepID=UPI0036135822